MSSRALRKAQRQREEQLYLDAKEDEAISEDDNPVIGGAVSGSIFSALKQDSDERGDSEEDGMPIVEQPPKPSPVGPETSPAKSTSSSRRKKKKKKKKKEVNEQPSEDRENEDDFLFSAVEPSETSKISTSSKDYCDLLAIDTQNLNVLNEMRRLFGKDAIEADRRELQNEAAQMRTMRGGRRAAATNRLAALARRRNIFVQGKEGWPPVEPGILGMEVVEKGLDGIVEYRFVHSTKHQTTQRRFRLCVESGDPGSLVNLSAQHPYHIATLIQLAEIAKHYADRNTTAEFLERALFSFGHAVHSTFGAKLREGKARLDFRRPENREFGLAVLRYVDNLKARATWRTVFEWTKLLFSLDPANDPYGLALVLDQYSLRANQQQWLIDVADTDRLIHHLDWLPEDEKTIYFNLHATLPLAFLHSDRREVAELRLFEAMEKFPWVFSFLFRELDIDPVPPSIWGKQPPDESNRVLGVMYVMRAKDLWGTPEAIALLKSVAAQAQPLKDDSNPAFKGSSVFFNWEAPNSSGPMRHVILTEHPHFIGFLRMAMKQLPIPVEHEIPTDPVPPSDNLVSYSVDIPQLQQPREPMEGDFLADLRAQVDAVGDGEEAEFGLPEHILAGHGEGDEEEQLIEDEEERFYDEGSDGYTDQHGDQD